MGYRETYASWQRDPEAFWMEKSLVIDWFDPPKQALFEDRAPHFDWFCDGQVNACWNAIDRHVEAGLGERIAVIHDSPATGSRKSLTYSELLHHTQKLAGALGDQGVECGDRVIIYMPMIPEAAIAMLACARIGAIHSVVFGGFAAPELAVRIDDATPKCIVAASCGIEPGRIVSYKPLLDAAISLASHQPESCIILQRPQERADMIAGRDHDWHACTAKAQPVACVPLSGNHPAYILYTSGTTGRPKGVVRSTAGNIVALNWSIRSIYDIHPGDVFWTASDIGWVVGHSYIVYAPLLNGSTTVIYEGKPVGTPNAGAFWRVISEHKVKALFTAPTAFRAIRRADPEAQMLEEHDISCLKTLFLAGERADPDTIAWAERHLGVPVIDHWWQTETGWPMVANPVGIELLAVKHGSPSVPVPGWDLRVLKSSGEEAAAGELGSIVAKLPLAPGALPTLWKSDQRFKSSYLDAFPGFYNTGDAGCIDEDGYVYVMGRTDDVINVAGHRLSTGAMEEILAEHPDVAECAVIGTHDEIKGQIPVGLLCLSAGTARPDYEIIAECIELVRDRIGPVAAFKHGVVVKRLPKTRSGKILRASMSAIADGREFRIPATIDDAGSLDEISDSLKAIGFPPQAGRENS